MSYEKWVKCESFDITIFDPSHETLQRTVEKAEKEPLAVQDNEQLQWLIFMLAN